MRGDVLKVSIITVCYNNKDTLEDTIKSVLFQTYSNIEYIIIDGGSTDGTHSILKRYAAQISRIVSEPDNGIYDAMNKGIELSTGDVVGILNSDDFYSSSKTIEDLVSAFSNDVDMVIGECVIIDNKNKQKTIRRLSGSWFSPWMLRFGWMPPHPATFIRKKIYELYGNYKVDYQIASDYEFFVRTLVCGKAKIKHELNLQVMMRIGGTSTSGFKSTFVISKEILRALRENFVYSNIFFVWSRLPLKFFSQKLLR